MESFIFSILLKLPPFYMISSKMLNKRIYQYMPFFFIYCYKTGDCKTTIFYVKVIQKQQNNALITPCSMILQFWIFFIQLHLRTFGSYFTFFSFFTHRKSKAPLPCSSPSYIHQLFHHFFILRHYYVHTFLCTPRTSHYHQNVQYPS